MMCCPPQAGTGSAWHCLANCTWGKRLPAAAAEVLARHRQDVAPSLVPAWEQRLQRGLRRNPGNCLPHNKPHRRRNIFSLEFAPSRRPKECRPALQPFLR